MAVLTEQKNTQVTTSFDYEILSPKQRTIVQQRAGEIKDRLRRTAQDVWEVGQKLAEVRSQLEHGQFEAWLSAEFGWSRRTAYNFINVYEAFSENTNFAKLDIATSALYKLAAPSTPKSVRNKFLEKAQQGEKITHKEISQALKTTKNSNVSNVKAISQAFSTTKNSNIIEKRQPISLPSQKIIQIIPKAQAGLEKQTTQVFQTGMSSEPVTIKPQITIKRGCWYLFDKINVLFCGDTALAEFCKRCPKAALALAVTSDDWDHDWLIEKANNLILLKESYLQPGLIEQIISLLSAEGDTVILPWLPDEEMLAIAHRLKRRIVAGDPSPERCQKAIAKVGRTVEKLVFPKS